MPILLSFDEYDTQPCTCYPHFSNQYLKNCAIFAYVSPKIRNIIQAYAVTLLHSIGFFHQRQPLFLKAVCKAIGIPLIHILKLIAYMYEPINNTQCFVCVFLTYMNGVLFLYITFFILLHFSTLDFRKPFMLKYIDPVCTFLTGMQ